MASKALTCDCLLCVCGWEQLAIGTNRGQVYIYDHATGDKTQAVSKHKRRILCGDWNLESKFAFGSEDRQITICLPDGRTFDQVKIKASPQSITVRTVSGLSVRMPITTELH